MARLPANIWVAAGDGDLDRVRHLIEHECKFSPLPEFARQIDNQNLHLALSPNVPDEFTYTPIHAAASYGHIHVLEYLLSQGGNVNITDGDGDTPLYTVENLETARFLVENGAAVAHRNLEDVSPIDHLTEEFPQIAEYLRSTTLAPGASESFASTSTGDSTNPHMPAMPSQHSQNAATEHLTAALMSSVQEIMQRAEAKGREPDEELRQLVSRTVLQGVITGFGMTTDAGSEVEEDEGRRGPLDDTPAKRARMD